MSTNIDQILQDLGTALKSAANGGTLTKGIRDTATREQIIVTDKGVQIGVLSADRISGNINVEGTLGAGKIVAAGTSEFANLKVNGKLEADTLLVKNIVSEQSLESFTKSIAFASRQLSDLDGKGLQWDSPDVSYQFVFKASPRRIFSTESIDLYKGSKYQIEGVDVLERTRLGNAVRDSNLRTVGPLETLRVTGSVNLGDTVFVNAVGRLGINTEEPNAVISAVDNNIEVMLGVSDESSAFVGTWGNNSFSIVTDNTKRITVTGNTTEFGNAKSKGAVVKVHGKLEVDSIVSDVRIEKTSPIEFLASKDNSIFGKGMIWKGEGGTRQFVMMPNPDRLYSTESIDLSINKEYCIDGKAVLHRTGLGESVISSSLTQLGTLTSLDVNGAVNLSDSISIQNSVVTINNSVTIRDGSGVLRLSSNGISADKFSINEDFEVDTNGTIRVGDRNNTTRNVNVYGKLSVNITNPQEDAAFSVDGMMVINGKRFAHGTGAPTEKSWNKGDIIWNSSPLRTSYVGWICVMSGTPGTWEPFGYIGGR
jgi:hypothetical protein